jgi:hypothetical protein
MKDSGSSVYYLFSKAFFNFSEEPKNNKPIDAIIHILFIIKKDLASIRT